MTPRLLEKYRKEAVPALMQKLNYKNPFQVPRIKKVVVNMGVGLGASDPKLIEEAQNSLTTITGQKAVVTKAKKAISNFKIKLGSPVGCMVTLRGVIMYEFLDRLINVVIPRVRDFKGLSATSFDEQGNYTFGLPEQTLFPEVDPDKVTRFQGMDIIINLTPTTKDDAYELLKQLGMPLREKGQRAEERLPEIGIKPEQKTEGKKHPSASLGAGKAEDKKQPAKKVGVPASGGKTEVKGQKK